MLYSRLKTYQIDQTVYQTHLNSLVNYIYDEHEDHHDDYEIVVDGDDYVLQRSQDWRWLQRLRNNLEVSKLPMTNYFAIDAI